MNKFDVEKMAKPDTIRAELVRYRFNIEDPSQRALWKSTCEDLKSQGVKCFNVYPNPEREGRRYTFDGEGMIATDVVLEAGDLRCAFDNQWNESGTDGRRLFDWYEAIYPNKNIKAGHFIRLNRTIINYRARVWKCGYCGVGYWSEDGSEPQPYCTSCMGSKYLAEKDLHLLLLNPLDAKKRDRDLSEILRKFRGVEGEMIARYRKEQTYASNSRDRARQIKDREDILHKYDVAVDNAKVERDGKLWFMDRGYNLDNLIFYTHTGRFCMGWRRQLTEDEASEWRRRLQDFPFDIYFKTA